MTSVSDIRDVATASKQSYKNCGFVGLWHRVAATEISKLVRSKCLRLGLEEKKTLDQEFKTLSVVIQKANSRMLTARQIFPSNEVDIPNVF